MSQPPPNPEDSDESRAAAGRAEILSAATDLFGESGYDGASMSAIAEQAGTCKANIFHHFRSKDALYLEVMREACADFAQATQALQPQEQGFAERLREFLRRDFEVLRDKPDRSHLIMREVLESGPSRGQALAREVFAEHFSEVVRLFEQAQAQGVFARDIPPAFAATLAIAANTLAFQGQHVLRHLEGVDFVDDSTRYAALVSRVLLDGLRHAEDDTAGSGGNDA